MGRQGQRATETERDKLPTTRDTETDRQTDRQANREGQRLERGREGERNSNSNSKTLFYKDCSLGSVKNLFNN